MHNVETLTNGMSTITYLHSELNVSSPGSYISRLEEFICTCLSISAENFEVGMFVCSMWTVGTRTLALLEELRRRDTTTRSRMVMLSQAGLTGRGRAEECMLELVLSATLRTSAKTRENFLRYSTNWIRELSSNLSATSGLTLTGSLRLNPRSTNHPMALGGDVEVLMGELNGFYSLELELATYR